MVSEWSLIWTPPGSKWYEMRSGVIAEIRAYFAYDEAGDAELTGFPYGDRRYLMD